MATPRSLWKRTRNRKTPSLVGAFFERVARKFWVEATSSDTADFELPYHGGTFGLEVKACGSRSCRVTESQLQRYGELAHGFPFDAVLYVIFLYRNQRCPKRGAKRGTKLSLCRTKAAVEEFIIRNCFQVFVLDHRVIQAMAARKGVHIASFPGDPDQTAITLPQALLKGLFSNPAQALDQLGLKRRQWSLQSHRVVLPGKDVGCLLPIEFPLHLLASRDVVSIMGNLSNRTFLSPIPISV